MHDCLLRFSVCGPVTDWQPANNVNWWLMRAGKGSSPSAALSSMEEVWKMNACLGCHSIHNLILIAKF